VREVRAFVLTCADQAFDIGSGESGDRRFAA